MRERGRVVVVGAGVIGLTSALCLRRRGFEVTVVADRFAPRITSVVAGALWEWPPAVCGRHQNGPSLARNKSWCETSYPIFADLARNPGTGVHLRPVNFYFRRPVHDAPLQRAKMEELAGKVQGFRHDAGLIAANGINRGFGLCDAYTHLAPMIDTDVYMNWLLAEAARTGCNIVQARIEGPISEQAEILARVYRAGPVVNCTGLGARALGDDTVFPVRGALIRVRNDGSKMPKLTQAHCVSSDGTERDFLFVVPRGQQHVVLGGFAEPGEWDLDIDLNNYAPLRDMFHRCVELLPVLAAAEIEAAEPIRVGLRPFRTGGVCLGRAPGTRLIHNYGHGGSGVTLSWGCAREVADLAEAAIENDSIILPGDCNSRPIGRKQILSGGRRTLFGLR